MKIHHLLPALFAAAVVGPAASAQGPGAAACRDDAARLCADASPRGGGLHACLSQHASELSAPCRAHVTSMGPMGRRGRPAPGPVQSACESDIALYCGDLEHSGGRVLRCLAGRQADLTPDCAAAVAGRKR